MSAPWVRKLVASALLLICAGALFEAVSFARFALTPAKPGSDEKVVFEVSKGQSPSEVSRGLTAAGIISDASSFVMLGRITREWKKLKAGEYAVAPGMTPIEVLAVITSGISINHPITVREGENMFEIAQDMEAKRLMSRDKFIALCRDAALIQSMGFKQPLPPSLEGYLFPETYFLNRTLAPEEMIRQMVKKATAIWSDTHARRAAELGLSRHQVMTLASIIEKETGAGHERPLISSVFHNRLRKRMRLQSDPTTIYGMWERYQGNIRREDLTEVNPYNTYAIAGLPAGPIGNPGKLAIEAALYPAESDFLFFVSQNDGTHVFTRTFGEHTREVRRYQMDPRARAGKSWRDLNKKSAGQ